MAFIGLISFLVVCSVFASSDRGQSGCRYGEGCVYDCLCTYGCSDETTGRCYHEQVHRSCPLDNPETAGIRRYGRGCRIGNVAMGKLARQSGQWKDSHAGLAVDGRITTDIRRCAHPDAGSGKRAWWYVDLQDSYTVASITIFNRNGRPFHRRTGDFRLGVGYTTDGDKTSLCTVYRQVVPEGGHDTIQCDRLVSGRYVTIIRNKDAPEAHLLGLCEVMVQGYKPTRCPVHRYGEYCGSQCSENCLPNPEPNFSSCYIADGRCIFGCKEGYWGPRCDQTCNRNCRHLADLNVCDRLNGTCIHGCQDSYYGDQCQHSCRPGCRVVTGSSTCHRHTGACNNGCTNDYYGDNCEGQCSVNCLRDQASNLRSCDISDGQCIYGCIAGHWGALFCEEVCHKNCQGSDGSQVCSRHDGRCPRCVNHYYGDRCQHSCSSGCLISTGSDTCRRDTGHCNNGCINGYHGNQCKLTCSLNCFNRTCRINGGRCIHGCNGPYWGDRCRRKCNHQCLVKDGLDMCSQSNGSCTHGCQEPYYGEQCTLRCSNNCQVVKGFNTCHRYTGDCNSGCQNGFHGEQCEVTCPQHCAEFNGKHVCEQRDGRCSQGCSDGRFGVRCEKLCENGCRPLQGTSTGACNQSDGICTHGCRDGLHGTYCNKTCNRRCIGVGVVTVCERYSGSCICQIGYYGKTCENICSSHCQTVDNIQTCNKVNGVCIHGCQLPQYETWFYGDYCNNSISYVEYPESNSINITEVTNDRIKIKWSRVEEIPLDIRAVFGYRIALLGNARNRSSRIGISEDSLSDTYNHVWNGLSANITYLIIINIYRQIENGKREDSLHSISVAVTTLAEPEQQTSDQFDPVGPVAGSVCLVFITAAAALLLIALIRRRKRQRKPGEAKDDTKVERPSFSSNKNVSRQRAGRTDTPVEKEIDNPSFENSLDNNDPNTIYYEFPPTNSIGDGTCVNVDDLEVYIGAKKYTEDGFKKEFDDIPNGELNPCSVAKQKGNVERNRFKNINAYDYTRVVLEANTDEDRSDYVNASFITGYPNKKNQYVATQGPKPNTIGDMWLMIWQLQANRIVMLTRIKEHNNTKCEQYWPEKVGEVLLHGDIKLTTSAREIYADYNLTRITVQNGNERRRVMHLQFLSWPDKQTPDQAFPLMTFRRKLRSFDREGTGPIIVHCSAGVGRTGTLIALDYLLDQMKRERKVDVFKLVTQLRNERMNMVQTLPQYVFLYETLLEAHQQEETAIPCNVYPERYTQLLGGNEYSNELPIEDQFKILLNKKQPKRSDNSPSGLRKENSMKNRDNSILPDDKYRLFLTTNCPGTNDYVNAIVVNSFLSQKAFIVTQLPLPDTVVDFWRLVYEHKCHTVVTLEEPSVSAKVCPKYWDMEKGQVRKFGNLEVRMDLKEDDDKDSTEERKFTLSFASTFQNKSVSVRHILFTPWPEKQKLPSMEDALNLLERIGKWQRQAKSGNIIIQCKDGARRSGMICAAHYMLEKMAVDNEVDVFLAVRAVALHRHQFVNDQEQYRFLHDIAMENINRKEIYENI